MNSQKLSIKDWKKYLFGEIFDIEKGFYNNRPEQDEEERIPFVSASEYNMSFNLGRYHYR